MDMGEILGEDQERSEGVTVAVQGVVNGSAKTSTNSVKPLLVSGGR